MRGETSDAVYKEMHRLAHELGPNAKLPSVRSLRKQLGVSQATLESAFLRLERQHVLLRRERSGIYVAPWLHERNVCLLCSPDFLLLHGQSPFWSLLLEQSRRFAQSAEMVLTLCFTSDTPLRHGTQSRGRSRGDDASFIPEWLVSDVLAGWVHGVVAVGVQDGVARWLESQEIPVVAYAGPARATVLTHRADVVHLGVTALIERGCRRICLLPIHGHGEEGRSSLREDRDAFQTVLEAHGLTLSDHGRLCVPVRERILEQWHSPSEVEAGFAAAGSIFGPSGKGAMPWERPDAVLSLNDMQTQGFLMGMTRMGLAPSRDCQIATHANRGSPTLLGWQEHLIRLEYDPSEIMRVLFEILDTMMAASSEPNAQSRTPSASSPTAAVEITRHIVPRLVLPE